MQFADLLTKLKEGKKISKKTWNKESFLKVIDGKIKIFSVVCSVFSFTSDELFKNVWHIIDGDTETKNASLELAIEAIEDGKIVKLPGWQDKNLVLNKSTREFYLKEYISRDFITLFDELVANDWFIME